MADWYVKKAAFYDIHILLCLAEVATSSYKILVCCLEESQGSVTPLFHEVLWAPAGWCKWHCTIDNSDVLC